MHVEILLVIIYFYREFCETAKDGLIWRDIMAIAYSQ